MYRMGSWRSSLLGKLVSSAPGFRDSAVFVVLCTVIVALGPVQFGFPWIRLPCPGRDHHRPQPLPLRLFALWLAFERGQRGGSNSQLTDCGIYRAQRVADDASIPNVIGWLAISLAKGSSFL